MTPTLLIASYKAAASLKPVQSPTIVQMRDKFYASMLDLARTNAQSSVWAILNPDPRALADAAVQESRLTKILVDSCEQFERRMDELNKDLTPID